MNDKMKGMKKLLVPMFAMLLMAGACSNTTKEDGDSGTEALALIDGVSETGEVAQTKEPIKREPATVTISGKIEGGEEMRMSIFKLWSRKE